MGKTLSVNFISDEDQWGITTSEEIHGVTDEGTKIDYCVSDLCDCPEDAMIGRSLLSGWEYIEILELGMKLAQEGYTDIVANEMTEEEFYESEEE